MWLPEVQPHLEGLDCANERMSRFQRYRRLLLLAVILTCCVQLWLHPPFRCGHRDSHISGRPAFCADEAANYIFSAWFDVKHDEAADVAGKL